MTERLKLSIALGDYDINRGIIDGQVDFMGIEAIPIVQRSPERHWRMLMHREFDVCELSLGSFVALISGGEESLVGIPVFPHRRFRHSYILVTGARQIESASELRGGTIGVRSWQVTGGIWMRGFLSEHYGLPLDSVTWMAQDPDDVTLNLPPALKVIRVPAGQTITDLCARGEIDGLVYPEFPRQIREQTGEIRRLFEDSKGEEERYFRQTGIFPIMHVIVIKRTILDEHPWIARSLMNGFTESKSLAMERMKDPRVVSLAWLQWLAEYERDLLGSDPWKFGLGESNRHNLNTFLRYAFEQGVSERVLAVEDLFAPSVLNDPPSFV